MKNEVGILFLPSGPGLNSAPAQVFLSPVFRRYGPAVFWDEPSTQRGQIVSESPKLLWKQLLDSMEEAVEKLPEKFVIITESFGSILAECLFLRLQEKKTEGRVLGILHTPPVLNLRDAFLTILHLAESDFVVAGDESRLVLLRRLIRIAESNNSLSEPALLEAIVVAFESQKLLPRYFQNVAKLDHWASGFGEAGYAPEPEMRERILRAMTAVGVPGLTEFTPDVPTWVCGGEFDPYQSPEETGEAIRVVNAVPGRRNVVKWLPFQGASHYPYADRLEDWEKDILIPFWSAVAL